ncbi:hypothetical protein WMY93_001818 [Mugilogobius chulae]|uniref:SPRY-associated domain-containing protein n=1 Tax=Mugilogobius chulae TaxID=88201 RepID=A0AAW0PVB8_9GOBI
MRYGSGDACDFSLDPNSAHTDLFLSENNRTVTRVEQVQDYPDHEDRFTDYRQVLSCSGLSGRCYWELDWSGRDVIIAASYRGIRRTGGGQEGVFGANNLSWSLRMCQGKYDVCHNNVITLISHRVGVSSEEEGVSSEREGVSSEKEGVSSEKEGVSSEKAGVSSEREGVSSEKEGVSSEREGVSSEKEGVSSEREGVSSEKERASSDRVGVASDRVGVTSDRVGVTSDRVGVFSDKLGVSSSRAGVSSGRVGVFLDSEAGASVLKINCSTFTPSAPLSLSRCFRASLWMKVRL